MPRSAARIAVPPSLRDDPGGSKRGFGQAVWICSRIVLQIHTAAYFRCTPRIVRSDGGASSSAAGQGKTSPSGWPKCGATRSRLELDVCSFSAVGLSEIGHASSYPSWVLNLIPEIWVRSLSWARQLQGSTRFGRGLVASCYELTFRSERTSGS